MANLEIAIIIYAGPSLHASECHVALAVAQDSQHFYMYHAVEDASTKNEMKFERSFRTVDPLKTHRRHQIIPVKRPIAKADFDKLDSALSSMPILRPRVSGCNCQEWLLQALESLEKEGLMKDVEPSVSLLNPFCLTHAAIRVTMRVPGNLSLSQSCDLNGILRKDC